MQKEEILEALKQIYDPEIPVDIVNLGLIVDIKIDPTRIHLKLTTTSPSCPAGNFIAAEVERAILDLAKVEKLVGGRKTPEVIVEVVDDSPWSPDRMTDEAKRMLGHG